MHMLIKSFHNNVQFLQQSVMAAEAEVKRRRHNRPKIGAYPSLGILRFWQGATEVALRGAVVVRSTISYNYSTLAMMIITMCLWATKGSVQNQ